MYRQFPPHSFDVNATGAYPVPQTPVALEAPAGLVHGRRRHAEVEIDWATDRGPLKAVNQDAISVTVVPTISIAVADGVGGGAFGEVASQALLSRVPALFAQPWDNARRLRDWLSQTYLLVVKTLRAQSERPGAATFVAAGAADRHGERWRLAWVGDCRAYAWRQTEERLEQLTEDHTYANLGQTPPDGGNPNDPARMVGAGTVGTLAHLETALARGDILLLCSDGLHKAVEPAAMAHCLGGHQKQGHALALLKLAQESGGRDDIAVACVHRRDTLAGRHPWLAGLLLLTSLAVGLGAGWLLMMAL